MPNNFKSTKNKSQQIHPVPPFVTNKILTDNQRQLLREGWPMHSFDNPVEVIPGIWLSGIAFDDDLPNWCHRNNFTHVLNAAGSYDKSFFYRTHPNTYNIKYLELNMDDNVGFELYPFLVPMYNFIEDVVRNNGKILVHCVWGQSRSVSCIIYYMMTKWKITYNKALGIIKRVRSIAQPNNGFEAQLQAIDRYKTHIM